MTHPVRKAAKIVGSQKALADAIGVDPSFISQMISGHRKVPIEQCRAIESLTNGKVTRRQLRPDFYALVDAEANHDGAAA